VPLPSASTSLIMSCSSASVGFCPSDRMTVPSSLVVMVPSPSLSKRENASLNSAICSSVSWSAISIESLCYARVMFARVYEVESDRAHVFY